MRPSIRPFVIPLVTLIQTHYLSIHRRNLQKNYTTRIPVFVRLEICVQKRRTMRRSRRGLRGAKKKYFHSNHRANSQDHCTTRIPVLVRLEVCSSLQIPWSVLGKLLGFVSGEEKGDPISTKLQASCNLSARPQRTH